MLPTSGDICQRQLSVPGEGTLSLSPLSTIGAFEFPPMILISSICTTSPVFFILDALTPLDNQGLWISTNNTYDMCDPLQPLPPTLSPAPPPTRCFSHSTQDLDLVHLSDFMPIVDEVSVQLSSGGTQQRIKYCDNYFGWPMSLWLRHNRYLALLISGIQLRPWRQVIQIVEIG